MNFSATRLVYPKQLKGDYYILVKYYILQYNKQIIKWEFKLCISGNILTEKEDRC